MRSHLGEVAVDLFRKHVVGMSAARDLGDVQGECAHAVDVGDDLDSADHRAQISGNGSLQGEQRKRALLADGAEFGDLVVFADYLFCQGQVCLEQGLGGALHSGTCQSCHLAERVCKARSSVRCKPRA